MVDNQIYIFVPKSRANFQIQTNQNIHILDRFKKTIQTPQNFFQVINKVCDYIHYLSKESLRHIEYYVISGDEEIVNYFTDPEVRNNIEARTYQEHRIVTYANSILNDPSIKISKG